MSESNKKNKGKDKTKSVDNKQQFDKNGGNPTRNEGRASGDNRGTPPIPSGSKPSQVLKEPTINIREPEAPMSGRESKTIASERIQKQPNKLKPEKQKNQSKCNKCEAYLIEMKSSNVKAEKLEILLKQTKEQLAGRDHELKEKDKKLQEKMQECLRFEKEIEEMNKQESMRLEKERQEKEMQERQEKEMQEQQEKKTQECIRLKKAVNVEPRKFTGRNQQMPAEPLWDQPRSSQNVDKTQSQNRRSPPSNSNSECIEEDFIQKNVKTPDFSGENLAGAAPSEIDVPEEESKSWADEDPAMETRTNHEVTRTREWTNSNHVRRNAPNYQNNRDGNGSSGEKRPGGYGPDPNRVVKEVDGDLFSVPPDVSLAHCVAADLGMSAGVAVDFRWKFKRVGELLEQRKDVGQVAILGLENRYIYYMITKSHSTGKPIMRDVIRALEDVRDHAVKVRVTKLAMPKIGSGLDRLDWSQVKRAIAHTFFETGIEITVYNFQPTDQPTMRRNARILHQKYPLVDIAMDTGLIFFGSADGTIEETSLLPKYRSNMQEFSQDPRKVGDMVRIIPPAGGDYLYGLVVKERSSDRLSYTHLEECMNLLGKQVVKDGYFYVGVEAFLEGGDELTTDKVVNVLRNGFKSSRGNIEIHICWPENLRKYHTFEDGSS